MTQELLEPVLVEQEGTPEPMEYGGFLIDLNSAKEGRDTTIYRVINRDTLMDPLQKSDVPKVLTGKLLSEETEEEYGLFIEDLKTQIPEITPERLARERQLFVDSFGENGSIPKDREYDLAVTALELLNDPDTDNPVLLDEFDEYSCRLLLQYPEQLYSTNTEDGTPFIVYFLPYEETKPAELNLE